ncbi:unnamed protein product, partial [Sphagnum troendelagicum]
MIKSSRVGSRPAAIPARSQPALISNAMDASRSSKYWDCVGSELQADEDPNLRELSQQTHYGSAPEYLWSELAEPEEDPAARLVQETDKNEDPWFLGPEDHLIARRMVNSGNEDLWSIIRAIRIRSIQPSQLEIVESIAEGGQAHVFLAKYTARPGESKEDVVVKRYKGRLGVRAVHQLRWRIAYVQAQRRLFNICGPIGVSEDNLRGEVSVVMHAYRGDLRNLMDKRMDYLKSRMPSNMQDDDATQMMMMPFPYKSTLRMMRQIAFGMRYLGSIGFIHRDLKASNIFVTPIDYIEGSMEIHDSRKVELKEDLAYDEFHVCVGDYESSDGVVGTGFWRPPEVLKALKEDITPTYTPAVDVYGYGMVCY